MTWADVSFVLGSPLSKRILECLNKKSPMTPLQISKETNIARSNISTKLSELRTRKLAECINSESRKWRFYKITDKGKQVLSEVERVK
jgi:DNA-binding transcriptional ArsR family regulator